MLNKQLVLCVTLMSALGFATTASATVPGLYVGAQAGYGNTYQQGLHVYDYNTTVPGVVSTSTNSNNTGGAAGRVFAGVQTSQNWAIEAGYTQFSNANATQSNNDSYTNSFGNTETENFTGNLKTQSNMIDLVVKGILPVENGMSIFAKAGIASVNEKRTFTAEDNDNFTASGTDYSISKSFTRSANKSEQSILPTATIGIQYDITPQLTADASWQHVQKVGSTYIIRNIDFAGAGLAYHFG